MIVLRLARAVSAPVPVGAIETVVTAPVLRLHDGRLLGQGGDRRKRIPLHAEALDDLHGVRVLGRRQGDVGVVRILRHGPAPDLGGDAPLGEGGPHVGLDVADEERPRPAVDPAVAGLVLEVHRLNLHALLGVLLHEPSEVEGMGSQRLRIGLDVAVVQHPRGKDPRARPEMEVRLDLQRFLDEGDQLLFVAGNGELVHRVVAGSVVERVPAHGIVAGAEREPSIHEVGTLARIVEELHHIRDLRANHREGIPSHLVESAAEPVPPLVRGARVHVDVGGSAGHLRHLSLDPIGVLGRGYELGRCGGGATPRRCASRCAAA